jgi:hypothetical protein
MASKRTALDEEHDVSALIGRVFIGAMLIVAGLAALYATLR